RRPTVRPRYGGRPRRRQGLRPGDDARRGRQLPRARTHADPHPVHQPAGDDRMTEPDPRLGLTVTHRRYVPYAHAHYGGNLVDGAEGLLAGYSQVRFLGPVRAGDVLEASAEVVRIGRRSRELRCTARVVARAEPERGPSAARVLEPPETVVEAVATLVVPEPG